MPSDNKLFSYKKPTSDRFFVVLKRCSTLFTLTCFTWVSIVSHAESTTSELLSFSTAIQRSTNHHPELRAYTYRMKSQQGYLTQAGVASVPEVGLTIEDALGSGEFNGI
jgi:cobalt-zinc-cadmium efflux system outer membrane protein